MAEGVPYLPVDRSREEQRDDESAQTKRAMVLAQLFRRLRRIERGIETEVDEQMKITKQNLRFFGLLGASAVQSDDED